MNVLAFFLNLAGATMLLLFAVRMVQTGIERAMGPSFKRMMTNEKRNRIQTSVMGMMLAIVLQSSTATALLATGFAAGGFLAVGNGLAIVLGADLGSALVIQILSFDLDWLVPFLLAIGGWLFLKTEQRSLRQAGRILLGVGFILISLQMIGAASEPIRESELLPAMAGYLGSEYITSFLIGAALAFIMHSSVAAILLFVTLVILQVLPVEAGVSLVLGANLGGAILPVWLSRGMGQFARRIPMGNFLLRGTAAIVALFIVNLTPVLSIFDSFGPGQYLVNTHLAFNFSLLIIGLPFTKVIEKPLALLMPEPLTESQSDIYKPMSALDRTVLNAPNLALSGVTREVLRMGQIVEVMVHPVMDLYENFDKERMEKVRKMDHEVNSAFSDIRRYVAELQRGELTRDDAKRARELTEFSINLENAGDIIAKRLLVLAESKSIKNLEFSKQGWKELVTVHERVICNIKLAFNVLISGDLEAARTLIEEKTEMANMERKSRKQHLKRLREGEEISFESSNIHLETLRNLKELNSLFASVAYPILYKSGQLLQTRLVETLGPEHSHDDN
ncbi:Na/Pi cotransporter [Rhodobacterales bacterium 52_120_T64]|nr:Na/Pi cotransporter [Rhodobacterales bacterium 52_120_T64]